MLIYSSRFVSILFFFPDFKLTGAKRSNSSRNRIITRFASQDFLSSVSYAAVKAAAINTVGPNKGVGKIATENF